MSKLDELLNVLDREFPLMSSRRLPFMRASDVVRAILRPDPTLKQFIKKVAEYRKWARAGYPEESDPYDNYESEDRR